ncbi:MAG: 30S ribosomal protein S9 [bacterium]
MEEGFYAVGRRKKATAKVRIKSGQGNLTVNKRNLENYFPRQIYSKIIREPLEKVDFLDRFDVEAQVKGGGLTGQAEAIRLGLSRAILKINPELRKPLKKAGLLTRDPRVKERKKPGLRGARARPQIAKR